MNLVCPYSWTAEIASYIKSLDTNHIVIEGTHAQTLSEQALSDPTHRCAYQLIITQK